MIFNLSEKSVNILIHIMIFWFLLSYFPPRLLFSTTTLTGGDTASFTYFISYLRYHLLSHGKIIGWCPGWYAGFPLFQFYFPLSFVIIGILSYLVPLQIAFRIVSISGIFLLPLAAFLFLKLLNFSFPSPIIAAILTLLFVFTERYTILGGNIPSALAGEISYSISLTITVLFLGFFYRGISSKKHIASNSLLLSMIILTSVYTSIFIFFVIIPATFIVSKNRSSLFQNIRYLSKILLLSFLLVSFWTIPLLYKHSLSAGYLSSGHIGYDKSLITYVPFEYIPLYLLGIYGIWLTVKERKREVFYLHIPFVVASLLFFAIPYIPIIKSITTNTRFISMMYLFSIISASYGFSEIIKKIKAKPLVPVIVFLIVSIYISGSLRFIPIWIEWNYTGFEAKPLWTQYHAINTYLSHLPEGRVAFEVNGLGVDTFGSTRAFESIPLFSGKPVLEGTMMEAAISAPFVVSYIQSEISRYPSCPLAGIRCPPLDFEAAAKHLKVFSVKYVVVSHELTRSLIRENSNYKLLKKFDQIEVYELKNNDGKYVAVPEYEPVAIKTNNWRPISIEWFSRPNLTNIPIIFTGDLNEADLKNIPSKIDADGKNITLLLDNLPRIRTALNCSIEEAVNDDEIRIKTSCIGKPHYVKVSYFPNWGVEGANKIYLVSPSFMLIFPEKNDVRLFYGETISDIVGNLLTILGILIVVYVVISKN